MAAGEGACDPMTIVAAFLVPGSPLPLLKPDNPPWSRLAHGYRAAARALATARPDVLLVYSTQWIAVLDELWQLRPHIAGVHVDENWHEYGELSYEIRVDADLAKECVEGTRALGITAKGVDYDQFPIDTGTIVANSFLNPRNQWPLVIAANNLYHGWDETQRIGAMAARAADKKSRKVAVIGIGGLSGSIIRHEIDIRADTIARPEDEAWNRRVLDAFQKGDSARFAELREAYVKEAKPDMGFKHLAWILGAIGGRYYGARVHAYGPSYGSGAAVVEFKV
jgi:2-aminophenol/2-amino-5-chlorophenol 1,6-dioxygenase alpha subunit